MKNKHKKTLDSTIENFHFDVFKMSTKFKIDNYLSIEQKLPSIMKARMSTSGR